MTALTYTAGHTRLSRFQTILDALNAFSAGIREGREIWTRYETLARMSDAELSRHGLSREQVPQAAVKFGCAPTTKFKQKKAGAMPAFFFAAAP